MAVDGLYLVTICSFSATIIVATSFEADPLQQAFLLVDLLKAEYARAKENSLLRSKQFLHYPTTNADLPTCPIKNETKIKPYVPLDGRRAADPLIFNNLTPNPKIRRKTTLLKSRRLEYDDAFGPHPGGIDPGTLTSTQETSRAVTSTTSTPSTDIEVTTTTLVTRVSTITSGTSSTKTTFASTHPTNLASKRVKLSKKMPPLKPAKDKVKLLHKKPTRDPIMDQVASEIIHEMRDSTPTTIKYAFYSPPLLTAKTERYTRYIYVVKVCPHRGTILIRSCQWRHSFTILERPVGRACPAAQESQNTLPHQYNSTLTICCCLSKCKIASHIKMRHNNNVDRGTIVKVAQLNRPKHLRSTPLPQATSCGGGDADASVRVRRTRGPYCRGARTTQRGEMRERKRGGV
ncbi:unnamed protein product [Leptosia nina]|uniref:Uncharacterized protein n=1 Tax=Leptosia nina TaxID=320188 RepID=A0AAV1K3E9_9NEOP